MNYDEAEDVYVPGNWTCVKCGFVLYQQTLCTRTGEIGVTIADVMQMSGEMCPNDGEPMRRTTWRERAIENQKWGESLMEDIIAATHAEHLPGALEAARNNHRDIHAYRGALGYAVPGWHDGKLSDGTEPKCGMCDARAIERNNAREELNRMVRMITDMPAPTEPLGVKIING
jgi:hypothetical protein